MSTRPSKMYLLAAASGLPLLVWWLGWYPGFASSDTIDQWSQAQTGDFVAHHPPIHTLYLDALSLGTTRPGLVTLIQIVAFAVLMVYAARWLMASGVPTWLAVGAAWLLGLSPAVAPTTLALWKDVVFGLFLLWAWCELLSLAVADERRSDLWVMLRIAIALAGVWLFRANGPITVVLTLPVIIWWLRRDWRSILVIAGSATAIVLIVVGPVYTALGVRGSGIEPAQVFLPDVAGSYSDKPETFTDADIALLTDVAPLSTWINRYDCYDSTALVFDPLFDQTPVRENPGAYRSLIIDVVRRDLDTVLDHRVCTANFLYWPPQPSDAYFHRPPYDIPANEVGLSRDPIFEAAFESTDRVFRWAAEDDILWLTWRPAIVLIPTMAAIVVFAVLPSGRRFLIPSSLFVAHLINVVVTTPAQEFRYAYPLYLIGFLTLPLLWPTIARGKTDGGAAF